MNLGFVATCLPGWGSRKRDIRRGTETSRDINKKIISKREISSSRTGALNACFQGWERGEIDRRRGTETGRERAKEIISKKERYHRLKLVP